MNHNLFRSLMVLQKSDFMAKLRVSIIRRSGIEVGELSSLGSGVSITTSMLKIGNNVRIGSGSRVNNAAPVEIHDWVRIGSEVLIETSTHQIVQYGSFRRQAGDEVLKPVIIERGCMIYARAIILPGVTVREGCVIGGGSVIDRSTEPNGFYIGNRPRKPIHVYPSDYKESIEKFKLNDVASLE